MGYCGVSGRFPVTRKGVFQVGIRAVLGDSLPIFRAFFTVFPIELFFLNDFPIANYIILLILACIKYCKVSLNLLILKVTALCLDEVVEVDLGLPHRRHHQRDMSSTPLDRKMLQ